jgi:hypothetical protein
LEASLGRWIAAAQHENSDQHLLSRSISEPMFHLAT